MMNQKNCPNCGYQNAPDMQFCTNCGKSLSQSAFPSQPLVQVAPPAVKKGGGKGLALAGVGCLALALVGLIGGLTALYYLGKNTNANKTNVSIDVSGNRNGSNTAKNSNANARPVANANTAAPVTTANSNTSSTGGATQIEDVLQPTIGGFTRNGAMTAGTVTDDFPGADKIVKADYSRTANKKINVIVAQFSSPAVAKDSYGYFLDAFKKVGANVLKQDTMKNKNGVAVGNIAVYSYKGTYETMLYADKYGVRIIAKDVNELGKFLEQFGAYLEKLDS